MCKKSGWMCEENGWLWNCGRYMQWTLSVCQNHVRDCLKREFMGELERMLRNEGREKRERRG